MRRARAAAAAAAILTALLLQASVVAPVTVPWPVSLPAVLVAAVAMVDGPGTGLAFGFVTGLVADLGSSHPAGVLALCWMGVGLLCGLSADGRSVRRDVLVAGAVCGLASSAATLLLLLAHGAGTPSDAVRQLPWTIAGDLALALLLVAPTRRMLRSESLRAPRPVGAEVLIRG